MITDRGFILVGIAIGGVEGIGTLVFVAELEPLTQQFLSSTDKNSKAIFAGIKENHPGNFKAINDKIKTRKGLQESFLVFIYVSF